MRPGDVRCLEIGSCDCQRVGRLEQGRERGEGRKTARTPAANPFAPLVGRPAFLQGEFPGATSPNGPLVQAKAVLGGSLPHSPFFGALAFGVQPESLTPCRTRLWHDVGCFAGGQIVFRLRTERVSERHFPRNNRRRVFRRRDHNSRGAGEVTMTVRTAVAVMAGTGA